MKPTSRNFAINPNQLSFYRKSARPGRNKKPADPTDPRHPGNPNTPMDPDNTDNPANPHNPNNPLDPDSPVNQIQEPESEKPAYLLDDDSDGCGNAQGRDAAFF